VNHTSKTDVSTLLAPARAKAVGPAAGRAEPRSPVPAGPARAPRGSAAVVGQSAAPGRSTRLASSVDSNARGVQRPAEPPLCQGVWKGLGIPGAPNGLSADRVPPRAMILGRVGVPCHGASRSMPHTGIDTPSGAGAKRAGRSHSSGTDAGRAHRCGTAHRSWCRGSGYPCRRGRGGSARD
jgi:hypothetical protein